ncbi:metallophosphoesterase family protein [Synechococcus sp. UW140]|uniref:metallophosphoesterase family protein n=1 Tax=Synechococcus sp. UW140 TaxID=368503 RepID=UPI00313840B6
MKIAIISDIHANELALLAVLNAIKFHEINSILVAGDLVGYYFSPANVVRLIQSCSAYVVRGNHEEFLLNSENNPQLQGDIYSKYGPGIDIALKELSPSQIDYIRSLPHPLWITEFNCSILMCHGSPFDINEYIYPDSSCEEIISAINPRPDVLILGHTHYPFHKFSLGTLIINPGSVGQPRNRAPGAHWAILDTDTLNVEHKIESYNAQSILDQCSAIAPENSYLREVILRQ